MLQRKTPLRSKPKPGGQRNSAPLAKGKGLTRKPIERKPIERKPIERKPIERKPIERKPIERKPSPQLSVGPDGLPKSKPRPKPKPLRDGEIGEAKTRKLIRQRSGGLCEICGSAPATDAAHRKPRSGGGLWSPSNLIDACHGCHMGNHAHPVKAKEGGWHLPSWSNPLLVPTRLITFGVAVEVLLDDDGGFTEVH